jgi:predicted ABC-type transport system involved in lysophospholipase L1 biosynthesis ATPase subunit
MKIVRLTAENIKKLRAVQIAPTGEVVTISGKNGAGKTSILDSIWWALAGTKTIQATPIRKGETKARIKLDLGELIVERKFSETGSTLTVESADGARFPSPQKMLDALLGELSFDPLAFARMEPRKQFDELRRVSKLDVDIDKLNAQNASDYAKRTDVNRDAKAKRAQAEGIAVPAEVKADPVDESALVDELQKAGETNAEIETRKGRRDAAQAAVARLKTDAANATKMAEKVRTDADLAHSEAGRAAQAAYDTAVRDAGAALTKALTEADRWESTAKQATEEAATLERKLDDAPPLPLPADVATLRQKIDAAKQINAAIDTRKQAMGRKDALTKEAIALETQSREITERMSARDKAKEDGIKNATMPVAGLGFGDGEVTYNGIPFEQASSAEQLRVSMAIAMAANPKLRVIRIVDGSLLDEDSLAAISEMAKADDFQVWIEQVSSSGTVGVVIDDGAVVSTPESRAKPAQAELAA